MVTIIVSEKGGQQSTFEFSKPEITIGRMKGNDIVLPKGNVSKRHSRIIAQDSQYFVMDLGSTNGTYVNGRKIAGEQPITDADKIYIGDFILQVDAAAASAGPPSPPMPPGPPSPPAAPTPPAAPPTPPPHTQEAPLDDLGLDALDDFDLGGGDNPTPAPPATAPTPKPGPAPLPPVDDAPKLQGGWQPGPQDEVTVDRSSDFLTTGGLGSRGATIPNAMLPTDELRSEFDADFHAAQHDVARVLFDAMNPNDLPFGYPPAPEDQERFTAAVQNAVNTVGVRVDQAALVALMVSECVGLGPLELYLDDPSVQDIYVNRYDQILIRRDGQLTVAPNAFSHPQFLLMSAYRLLGPREVEVLTDEVRFGDGTKVHIVMPPIASEGPAITVRKPPASQPSLEDLVHWNVLSAGMAEFLQRAVEAGRSMVIAGPTSSGKTSLLSALTASMPATGRVVSVEDHASLLLPANAVRLEANPATGYDSRYLVQAALQMHPQRIILDECRGAEAYDWVTAATCGTEGSIATVHGVGAADALGRLETLCLLGARDLSPRGIREQIARAANIVIVTNRTGNGFRVQQISEVQGVDLDTFRLNDVFYFRAEGSEGAFHPTGFIPLFFEELRNSGADVNLGIFRE